MASSEVNLENAEYFSNLRYVLTHNLTIDHLLFADDVKLIAPENNRMPSKAPCSLVPNDQRVGS